MKPFQVLERYWSGNLPVDPRALAQAAGIRVENRTELMESSRLMPDIPLIELRAQDTALRQRFATAHALGHYFLGHWTPGSGEPLVDTAQHYVSGAKDAREQAANAFALELLLPASLLRWIVQHEASLQLDTLAHRFQVSEVALHRRLRELSLLPAI